MVDSVSDHSIRNHKIDWIICAMNGCLLLAEEAILYEKCYEGFKQRIESSIDKFTALKGNASNGDDEIIALDDE